MAMAIGIPEKKNYRYLCGKYTNFYKRASIIMIEVPKLKLAQILMASDYKAQTSYFLIFVIMNKCLKS